MDWKGLVLIVTGNHERPALCLSRAPFGGERNKVMNYYELLKIYLKENEDSVYNKIDTSVMGHMACFALWLNEHAAEHQVHRTAFGLGWLRRIQNKIIGWWWYVTSTGSR